MIKKICLVLLILLFAMPAFAGRIFLTWKANDTIGYKIYVGHESGVYHKIYDVGMRTSVKSPKWWPPRKYYFVITAYDAAGNESKPTKEIMCEITK